MERGSKGAPWRAVKGAAEDGVRALGRLSKLSNTGSCIAKRIYIVKTENTE